MIQRLLIFSSAALVFAGSALPQSASQQIPLPVSVAQGGTGATTASGAQINLGLPSYLASPPAIGGTVAGAGSFSSLTDTGLTGSIQCLQANSLGAVSGTGVACGSGVGSTVYPSAGVANSTGSAWGASYSVNGSGNLLAAAGTLIIPAAKTATISNTITLAGTDSTTMTFPSTSGTLATLNAAQSFTAVQSFATLRGSNLQNAISGHSADIGNAPTISGFGSGATIVQNGSFAFAVTVGSGASATGETVTLLAVTNGWVCTGTDYTTPSEQVRETTYSTVAPVFSFYNWSGSPTAPAQSDVVGFTCRAN